MAQPFHLQSISLPLTGTADAASAVAVAAVGKITCACRHRRCGVGSSRWNINHAAVRPRVISVGTTSNPLILDIPVSFGVLCVAQYNHKLFFMTIKDRIIFCTHNLRLRFSRAVAMRNLCSRVVQCICVLELPSHFAFRFVATHILHHRQFRRRAASSAPLVPYDGIRRIRVG